MSMATMMAIMKMPRDGDRAEDRDALPRQPRLPVHWEFLNLLRISPTLQLTAWLFFLLIQSKVFQPLFDSGPFVRHSPSASQSDWLRMGIERENSFII